MELDEFQRRALETDRTAANYEVTPEREVVVSLLGIAGEAGTLATAYKKRLRDGDAYKLHRDHVATELGDLMWYVAVLAAKFELSLSKVCQRNLEKTDRRWGTKPFVPTIYDEAFPADEQLPRKFSIEFREELRESRLKAVMYLNGEPLGDPLTDNADNEDGYRFHDAFHLAFMVVLGWSPVMRKLMRRKRRSDSAYDENQDGGRAIVVEEGVAALVFEYGAENNSLEGVRAVDYDLITTIKAMTKRLEVSSQPERAWEKAIQAGWKIFRELNAAHGGTVDCDLDAGVVQLRR